jgi:ACS family hexuronate transporter-like MFS transporter
MKEMWRPLDSMNKPPIKHLRWYMAVLLCLASELNYLDRQTLSVLAKTIQDDLGFSTEDYSIITAAFLWSYSVMYFVSGLIVDRIGTKRSFLIFVSGWSVANMLHALAQTLGQFWFFRFLLGAMEPANFPAGIRAVTEWFPMKERALAVGIFNAGTALGSMVAPVVVGFIALKFGWRMAFVLTGALGFVWVVIWIMAYRLPKEHPRLGKEELQLIQDGQEQDSEPEEKRPWFNSKLLKMSETWGCVLARVLTDPISFFLFFWIPLYLQNERGFSLKDIALFVWIPFAALTVGNLCSGAIPRYLVARGWSVNTARKTTMLTVSCLMPICCLMVTQVQTPFMAMVVVTLMMFGHAAWGNVTLPAEIFPKHAVGTVTGLGGAFGALAGAITQLTIGRVVEQFSFAPIFAACAGMYLLAFLGVHFLIGPLGVVRKV